MNKFFVKIDRFSMRPNPRAGETKTEVVGRWSGRVIVKGNVWVPENPEDGYLLSETSENNHSYVCACQPSLERLLHALRLAGANLETDVTKVIEQTSRTTTHEPLPRYIFRYIETQVECSHCGAKFPHSHLKSDHTFDGLFYADSDEICPFCNAYDCCEVEFEQPDLVAQELWTV